jgi:hypothetical protein
MLFVSYVPLLTDVKGFVRTPDHKEKLIEMLTEASHSYRIEAVVWALEEYGTGTRPYPVFLVQHASEICQHLVEWSGGKPAKYFTLVWRPNGKGYDLALVPDFDKSARRYHKITGDKSALTILGHLFLYQAAQSHLNLVDLEGRNHIKLGWTSKVNEDATLADYSEVTVRFANWNSLPKEEQEPLEGYWKKLN